MFNFDLEYGKVVCEFDVANKDAGLSDSQVQMIANNGKNSSCTSEQVFNAVSGKSIFQLDPRLATKSKVSLAKDYKTNPKFSTIGTSMQGNFAIGSLDGAIRLYK